MEIHLTFFVILQLSFHLIWAFKEKLNVENWKIKNNIFLQNLS